MTPIVGSSIPGALPNSQTRATALPAPLPPWAGSGAVVTRPEDFGAKRDGSSDDTAAINAAIAVAVAGGQANGTNYAEVQFSVGIYQVNGALRTDQSGRAQIPLPKIDTFSSVFDPPKFTLVLRGTQDSSALWDGGQVLLAGAVLRSNLNTGFDATFGSPSVIGGPTQQQVGDSYSTNLLLVMDGFSLVTPNNGQSVGIDLQNVAQCNIGTLSLNGSVDPETFTAAPTNGGVGLRMPVNWGEDNSNIWRLAIMGYTYGFIPGEHTTVDSAVIFFSQYGVAPQIAKSHAIRFGYLSTEGCTYHISMTLASTPIRMDIHLWDTEDVTVPTTYHLDDPANLLYGVANFHCFSNPLRGGVHWGAVPLVNGGRAYKVVNASQAPGAAASPAVPASTVALTNPYWRDAVVTISGGAVTVIRVDQLQTDLVAGTVVVPAGKTISITYTAAPTWKWLLL